MIKRVVVALLVGGLCAWGCGPEVEEPPRVDEEAERLCEAFCDLKEECGWPDPDTGPCFDVCLDDPGWTIGDGACRNERVAYSSCVNALTCEELADKSVGSDLPPEERPCHDVSREFSLCLGDNASES